MSKGATLTGGTSVSTRPETREIRLDEARTSRSTSLLTVFDELDDNGNELGSRNDGGGSEGRCRNPSVVFVMPVGKECGRTPARASG